MMKSRFFCLLFLLIFYSCIEFDGEIPLKYRKQLNHYGLNDTIYYRSNFGDLDTIAIVSFDSLEIEVHGPSHVPNKTVSLNIKHLPLNNWDFRKVYNPKTKKHDSISYQSLITVFKENYYNDNIFYCNISYRDFSGSINFEKLEKTGIDTVKTMRGILNSGSVIEVYWSKEKGMIGYKKNDAQIYNLEKR